MNVEALREEFPILKEKINGKQLVYLDNAATTQKPLCVIEAMSNYYLHHNANVHRGVHTLSQIATDMFEKVREQVRSYLNAAQSSEIIYTKGATEGLNLIAETLSQTLKVGDEIIISESEHHSNIVPWQLVAEKRGLLLKVIPMNDEGCLQVEELDSLITEKTRVISVAQVSNSLGVVHDLKTIISKARAFGGDKIKIVVDGAQGIVHSKVDVRKLDCDFYCFSAHKLYAPMGVGIVYGKQEILETLPPYQGGGEMIKEVSFDKTTFNVTPYRFEAGTPSVADVIGLGAALEFLEGIGLDKIFAYEDEIMNYAQSRLKAIDGVRIYAESAHKAGSISFNVGNVHPFDVGTLLDQLGIAIRTGHHCAQPVMKHFGIPGTARASFALYTTKADIDALVNGLERIIPMLL